jgi:adenylyltransferase/sulfurtransferase
MAPFTEEQIERYSRQILLPQVGGKGQEKLLKASVLLIGAGGLGSPIGLYLAAAGVGAIGLVDSDIVDLSNLQRQVLHSMADLGRSKCLSAKESLQAINPEVTVVTYEERITAGNILRIIADYDIVVDGSDNFPTRFLVNDACVMQGKPLSHGSIFHFEGQATTIIPDQSPCYRCLFPTPPPAGAVPSCQEAGVMGVTAGLIGLIQATEVIKAILGIGDLLTGRLLLFNGLDMTFRVIPTRRRPDCPVCGEHPTITELIDYEAVCELRT